MSDTAPENDITILEGADLKMFLATVGSPFVESAHPYRVRIWAYNGQIKVKVNEGVWSPAVGKKDA